MELCVPCDEYGLPAEGSRGNLTFRGTRYLGFEEFLQNEGFAMNYGFGVDVGGTTVKLGFFARDGALLKRWEIPTRTRDGGKRILPDIARAVEGCLAEFGVERAQVLGIGVGVPGPVDEDGTVNHCVNLGWGVFPLEKTLSRLTGIPVKGGNDANFAALGESWKGSGQGSRNSILVTLGTGVGCGIVAEGKIFPGAHGTAGELGHITVNPLETRRCSCGKRGCVEQYASATGIVRLAKLQLAQTTCPSALRARDNFSCKDVFDAAAQGDAAAQAALDTALDCLGAGIADACCIIDPELVILGGGVSKAGEPLVRAVEERFRAHMFHACASTRFTLASLGNDAGIYGGFRCVLDTFGGA